MKDREYQDSVRDLGIGVGERMLQKLNQRKGKGDIKGAEIVKERGGALLNYE